MKREDADLKGEVRELQGKACVPEEIPDAIQPGAGEPAIVPGEGSRQVSTPRGADHPYQAFMENIREGALTLSPTGVILYTNTQFAEMVQVSRDKVPGTSILDHICPEHRAETWGAISRTGKTACRISVRIRQGSGSIPVLLSMNPFSRDGEMMICVVVTDRKNDEDVIRLQARMLNAVGDAVIAVDTDHNIIFWNEAATRTYGWRPEEVIGHTALEVTVPELSKNEAEKILAMLDRGEIWSGEYRVRHRDGHEFSVHVTDSPVFDDDGNLIAIIGASHDISKQNLADEILQQSKNDLLRAHDLLEAVTTATGVIIAAQDMNFCYTYFNKAYKDEIKRLTGKGLTLGTSMVELFAGIPEEQKMAVAEWSKVLNGENVNRMIEFGDHGSQQRVYQVLHTPIRDEDGTIVGAGEVAYEVTKQVRVENKLRETTDYLDSLITYANAPIIVWDPHFRITRFNRAFEHLTGRKIKEVLGQHLEILFPETHLTQAMDLIRKTREGERWESVEIPILHKRGGTRTVLWNSASIFGSDGRTLVSTIAQGQDITGRKKMESKFRERAAEYATINVALEEEIRQRTVADTTLKNTLSLLNASLEATADGILVVDWQGMITSYNQNFVTMWNVPKDVIEARDAERVIHQILPQIRNPEDFRANFRELQIHPGRESFDMIEFLDGKFFERYSKPQKIGDSIVGRVWSFRDITDRKYAEERLLASLQEKEVLLREIHHRVKNNLQLISGLLDMTRMRSSDGATTSILTDMMLKIQTMAQIHTRLYESKQFGRVSITDQIRDQVSALSHFYSPEGHEISCVINSDELFLPVDQALPCALIVNEVLSNAYKHAFRGRKKGTIEISAFQEGGRIRITVRDDGIGLPPHFDISRTNSLGLKLIRNLVQHQLKGSLMIHSDKGTETIVEFPISPAGT